MNRIILLVLLSIISGCASVPANSPMLNQKISDGILKLQTEHLVTLDKVYELSINKVNSDYDKFYSKAIDLFKAKTGKDPSSKEDFKIVSIIAASIRDKVISELNKNKVAVRKKLVKNYELLSSINNEVTLYLHSAARYAQARNETMALINNISGVDLDIGKLFDDMDSKLEQAINKEVGK